VLLAAVAATVVSAPLSAQERGSEAIEQYLMDRELNELLAMHLQIELERSSPQAKIAIAERLGSLYASLLENARSVDQRRIWEDRSRALLESVPQAETHELRLNLAKVRYLAVEGIAENARLGLSTPEERAEAERVLRDVRPVFADMARELHRRVDQLESQESRGRSDDWKELDRSLAEARRLRSIAMYYAGWTEYYLAFLSRNMALAEEALGHFGWLLNASTGEAPELERLPKATLRYEHVARAAVGSALCFSLRGEDSKAVRWLDAVEEATEAPASVKAQLFSRRLVVLAAASRWSDVERLVTLRQRRPVAGSETALSVGEARLLAVLTLQALEQGGSRDRASALVQSLAEEALAQLVNQGEVGHVLSLVTRYGTAPIGDQGFIVLYVRGLQAYDQARSLHKEEDAEASEPSSAPGVVNRYMEAAEALLAAMESEDAERFAEELANAGLMAGYALFYADRTVDAADLLEASYRRNPDAAKAEDALWLAVVALERAVTQGNTGLRDRLASLATVYIQTYPDQERAARLLLIQTATGLIDDEEAVEILLAVDREAPIYNSARRQAARLLYKIFRAAPSADRDFAALQFIEVGEGVLMIEEAVVASPAGDEEAMEAGRRIMALSRQLLDAMLGLSVPDVSRTERVFQSLQDVSVKLGLDTSDLAAEIAYRRLQVALARGFEDEIEARLTELHAIGGRYATAADRLLYRRAYDDWTRAPHDTDLAVAVVRHGLNLMTQFGEDAEALNDPVVYGLHDTVASAAAVVWRLDQDVRMREIAIEIDERLIVSGRRSPGVLTRFAELSESAGRIEDALDAWRTLLAGYDAESEDWFEARYQSLRLLLEIDQARARVVMDQHKLLHPSYGPEPWGEQLSDLDKQIPAAAPAGVDDVGGGGG
jgi:hypothetical protein